MAQTTMPLRRQHFRQAGAPSLHGHLSLKGYALSSTDLWTAVSAIATALGSIVVTLTAIFAIRQLREMSTARQVDALSKAFDQLSSPETLEARHYLRTHTLAAPEQQTDLEFKMIDQVFRAYERVAIMVKFDLISRDIVLAAWSNSIIMFWEIVAPRIKHERITSGHTSMGSHFEWLYGIAKAETALRGRPETQPAL